MSPHNLVLQEDAATKVEDTSKSPDQTSPTELEDEKEKTTAAKEEQTPDTQPTQPSDKDKPDTHSNTVEEVTN